MAKPSYFGIVEQSTRSIGDALRHGLHGKRIIFPWRSAKSVGRKSIPG